MSDRWLDQMRGVVGDAQVLIDPEITESYTRDWSGRWSGPTRAVLRPGSVEEVAETLRVCSEHMVPVVPQGGNTGLVGGSVPHKLEAVLSLGRLGRLDPVDTTAGRVTVGAGVTLGAVQEHARAAGLDFCVDLGARDSATVGGLVATNAGGTQVMRYGSMRAQVLGLEFVLASGDSVRRLDGHIKDNTGYDLAGLICGSEGTLAVVTAATLRLRPLLTERLTALVGVADVGAALELGAGLRAQVSSLESLELMFAGGIDLVCEHTGMQRPLARQSPCYVLVECAARSDPTEELAAALEQADIEDTAVASDPQGRASLWDYRERHTETVNALGGPHKLDVTLPFGRIPEFVGQVRHAIAELAPRATLVLYGHLGDGNLHVNVAGLTPDDERVDDAVLHLVARLGGSISAEHGIGVAKRSWLPLTRSRTDIELMRSLKTAWDPENLLNPNVLFGPVRRHN